MPDTDLLADTFAQFRTEVRPEIRSPGPDTTRRTVHRRRTVRIAGTTVLAIATVVGLGIGLLGTPHADRSVPAGPTPPPDTLAALSVEALAALGYAPTAQAPASPSNLLPLRAGVFYAPVDEDIAAAPFRLGTASDPLPRGEYTMQYTCVGPGGIKVIWRWAGGASGGDTIECGDSRSTPFTATVAGVVDVTVSPNDDAKGRAGMAFAITDPRVVTARNLLGTQPRTVLSGDDVLSAAPTSNIASNEHDIGTYRLSIACVGKGGAVGVSFALGGAGDETTLECPTTGAAATLTAHATVAGAPISVTIDPAGATPGSAAVAYWVEKT